ncbi:pollen-specific leucine-rich repeat extensin-like protein 4 [Lactuca sativa]|uniref:pollen-specific leucine-rich repeat extensin-like protein 4 n=1 Tax=Lactuca sativa TaxID=4236 RepID=UPI000CD9E97E|nr:pollen-specific leucine-rich repeat extensin-like protein 4 [Lactuca sativa]
MTDALLSSIATFHTKKITVTDSTKYSFNGSTPESMYRCVTNESNVMASYIKTSPIGPRQLTPEIQSALDAVEKPTKQGKKPEPKKSVTEGPSSLAATPKKCKSENAVPSASKNKKVKKMARKMKEPSPTNSDQVPSPHDEEQSTDEEEEVHDEGSSRGHTPPRSPTAEVQIHVSVPTPPPSVNHTTIPIFVAPIPPPVSSQPTTTAPLPPPIFSQATTTTTTDPQDSVNVSDTGAPTDGYKTPVTTIL